jgi:hypothetical protein
MCVIHNILVMAQHVTKVKSILNERGHLCENSHNPDANQTEWRLEKDALIAANKLPAKEKKEYVLRSINIPHA